MLNSQMAILTGSMGYVRFWVEGEVAQPSLEQLETIFQFRRFVPLHPEGDDLESSGFVPVERPFADELALTNDLFLFDSKVVIGFRTDSISFPKPLVRDMVFHRVQEQRERLGAEPSVQTRRAIETSVLSELRRRVLPKSKVIDVAWDLERREVRFFSRGQKTIERFLKLFEQSFGLTLRQSSFPERAMHADLSLRSKAMLESLQPQMIFRPMSRVEMN